MTYANLVPVADHLWQSTLCVAAAWVLTRILRTNRAAVRYWVWLGASIKFVVPFSLLVSAGSRVGWRVAPAMGARWPLVVEDLGRPFAVKAYPVTPPAPELIPALLFGVWLCGFAISAIFWCRCWRQARAARLAATPLALELPIPAMSCASRVEPGVFGIRRPVLLLPEGIAERLTADEMDAVLRHEMSHVRRRDNLTGAIHLMVEAVFWFHPVTWWIRARLVEERERACDEAVLQSGSKPEVYAEGILKVCRLYIEPSRVCVSGITGSDLKRRVEEIMISRGARRLDWGRKLLLATVGAATAIGPIALGVMNAPASQAQPQEAGPLAFEVASVKANRSGDTRAPSMILPGGRFTATNNTVRALIQNAYGISVSPLLEGGPGWIDSARYDIDAKAGAGAIPAGASNRVLWEKTRLMLRTLLVDRFQLAIRRETKEMPVYQLVVGKNGPKLQKSERDCGASWTACHGFSGNPTRLSGLGVDMFDLALILTSYSDRPVQDRTGVAGLFDIKLQWNPFAARPQPADDLPRSPRAEALEGVNPDLATLPTLFTALEQQVGLRLESRKGPVESYVIEHVERASEN